MRMMYTNLQMLPFEIAKLMPEMGGVKWSITEDINVRLRGELTAEDLRDIAAALDALEELKTHNGQPPRERNGTPT